MHYTSLERYKRKKFIGYCSICWHNLNHWIIRNSSEIMVPVYLKRLKLALRTIAMKTYHQIFKVKSFYYPMQVSSFQIRVAHFSAKQLKGFSQAKYSESIRKMANP